MSMAVSLAVEFDRRRRGLVGMAKVPREKDEALGTVLRAQRPAPGSPDQAGDYRPSPGGPQAIRAGRPVPRNRAFSPAD
jgi:hypothetical protein